MAEACSIVPIAIMANTDTIANTSLSNGHAPVTGTSALYFISVEWINVIDFIVLVTLFPMIAYRDDGVIRSHQNEVELSRCTVCCRDNSGFRCPDDLEGLRRSISLIHFLFDPFTQIS